MRQWGHRIIRAAAVAALVVPAAAGLVSSACGAGGYSNEPDGGNGGDAGGPLCEMVVEYAPSSPEVGATIDLDGSIYKQQVSGFESYTFAVTRSGTTIATSERSPFDGSKVQFVADQPGPYRVELRGDVDGLSCTDGVITINVTDAATPRRRFRFHFVPALGQPAPQQDLVFEVPGLAPYDLGTVGLDTGIAVGGTVTDAGGNPRATYLRFTRQSDGAVTEAFADATGAYATRLADGTYDLLAVPEDASLAPRQVSAVASAFGDLTLTAGDTVTGTVKDGGGAAIAGARVALRTGGVPSAVGMTDGTGAFSLAAHLGGSAALTVSPPAASGLPRLDVDVSAGLTPSAGAALAIAYAAGLTSRTLAFDVTTAGGAAAPGASVTFVRRASANAGTVTPAGGSAIAATGGLRVTAEADGAGHVSGLVVPDGVYDVIARSAGGAGVTLEAIDLFDRPVVAIDHRVGGGRHRVGHHRRRRHSGRRRARRRRAARPARQRARRRGHGGHRRRRCVRAAGGRRRHLRSHRRPARGRAGPRPPGRRRRAGRRRQHQPGPDRSRRRHRRQRQGGDPGRRRRQRCERAGLLRRLQRTGGVVAHRRGSDRAAGDLHRGAAGSCRYERRE